MYCVAEVHAPIVAKAIDKGKKLKNFLPLSLKSLSPKRSQSLSFGFENLKFIDLQKYHKTQQNKKNHP